MHRGSYGLLVDEVDLEAGSFGGRSRIEGRYWVEASPPCALEMMPDSEHEQNGCLEYDEATQHLAISYEEASPLQGREGPGEGTTRN